MNVTLADAEEVFTKKDKRVELGRILLKGDNIVSEWTPVEDAVMKHVLTRPLRIAYRPSSNQQNDRTSSIAFALALQHLVFPLSHTIVFVLNLTHCANAHHESHIASLLLRFYRELVYLDCRVTLNHYRPPYWP